MVLRIESIQNVSIPESLLADTDGILVKNYNDTFNCIDKVVDMYKSIDINPSSKQLIFSHFTNAADAKKACNYANGRIKVMFQI